MKILVTGGAGFIGSHTVDLLLQEGAEVCVYDNFSSGKKSYLDTTHAKLNIIEADILNYEELAKAILPVDAVLHLAAIASVPESIAHPIKTLQTNTLGLLHVLEAIRTAKKNHRLVFASSAAVYGAATQLPCSDEVPLHDAVLSPYALEKINAEKYAELYQRLFAINSLGLRYFNVYGTRQDPNSFYSGVIAKLMANYQAQKPITIFGDGLQSRDFIAVKDVARANVLALQSDISGVLNIATGKSETLLDLISHIEKAGGYPAIIHHEAARLGDIRESYANIDKAKKTLKFSSQISLQQGIQSLQHKN